MASIRGERPRAILCVLAILLAFAPLFLIGLHRASFFEGDEIAYAEVSREMLVRHDFVGTYFNCSPFFDKPPLVNWGIAAAYLLLGQTERAARLPSALFGLACLGLVFLFGRSLYGRRAGLAAAATLGTSLLLVGDSRLTLLDTTLTFLLTLAFYAYWQATRGGRQWSYLIVGAALGLATLTKGPVALVVVGPVVLLDLGVSRKLRQTLRSGWAWSAPAIWAAIAAPWYIAMLARYGEAFLASNFTYHMFTRFARNIHGAKPAPLWYFLVTLLVGFLPWSVYLPQAVGRLVRRWRERPASHLLLYWAAWVLLFFSLSKTKFPGYILPMLPPLALLVAQWWSEVAGEERGSRLAFVLPLAGFALAGAVFLILLAYARHAGLVPARMMHAYRLLHFFPAAALVGAVGTALAFVITRKARAVFLGTAIIFYLSWGFLGWYLMPAFNRDKPAKSLCAAVEPLLRPADVVVSAIDGSNSAVFYLRRKIVFAKPGQAASLFDSEARVFVLIEADRRGLLGRKPWKVAAAAMGGLALVNRD